MVELVESVSIPSMMVSYRRLLDDSTALKSRPVAGMVKRLPTGRRSGVYGQQSIHKIPTSFSFSDRAARFTLLDLGCKAPWTSPCGTISHLVHHGGRRNLRQCYRCRRCRFSAEYSCQVLTNMSLSYRQLLPVFEAATSYRTMGSNVGL